MAWKNPERYVRSSGRISLSSWPYADGCLRNVLYRRGRSWRAWFDSLHRAGAGGETHGDQASGHDRLSHSSSVDEIGRIEIRFLVGVRDGGQGLQQTILQLWTQLKETVYRE